MADRYLLESGAPDGYQLEDASGVLLLEGGLTDEDGDSWWAGVQHSFVRVPIALAALALSVSVATAATVNHTDDVPQQIPADSVQASSGGQRARITPVFHRWPSTEEWLPSVIEETYWWEAPRAAVGPYALPTVADDAFVPPPAASIVDDDSALAIPSALAWTPDARAFTDDDAFVPNAPVPVEEDWLVLPTQARLVDARAFLADDEIVPQPASVPADSSVFTQRAQVSTIFKHWELTDEWIPSVAATIVEDDGWSPPVIQSSTIKSFAWCGEDELPAGFVDEVYGWDAQFQKPLLQAPLWTVEDERPTPIVGVAIGDVEWALPTPAVPKPTIFTPNADEDFVTPATPGDDSAYQVLAIGDDRPPRVFYSDDDVPIAAAPPTISEDYYWSAGPYLVPPKTIVWVDPDTQFVFGPIDEGQGWTAPIIIPPDPKTIVWVDGDTEFRAVVVEEDWNVWTPPLVPAKPLYAPDRDLYIVPQPVFTPVEEDWWLPVTGQHIPRIVDVRIHFPFTADLDVETMASNAATPEEFFIVQAQDRWFVVDAQGRWFVVDADDREFDV